MMHNHVYADTARPCWEVQNFLPKTFSNACYTAATPDFFSMLRLYR